MLSWDQKCQETFFLSRILSKHFAQPKLTALLRILGHPGHACFGLPSSGLHFLHSVFVQMLLARMDVGCEFARICSHFLWLKYAFYYHNGSQRLEACQTWWFKTCQNSPKELCFETLIKVGQSQVRVYSQLHEMLKKKPASKPFFFSTNAYHAGCCIYFW